MVPRINQKYAEFNGHVCFFCFHCKNIFLAILPPKKVNLTVFYCKKLSQNKTGVKKDWYKVENI